MRCTESAYMKKKFKLPEISDKEKSELAEACRMAYGNDAADKLMDEALAYAEQLVEARREEQTRTE